MQYSLRTNAPLVTIGELHVHCVAAEKCLGVQRDLDVGGVLNGVADQNQVGDWGLLVPVGSLLSAAVIHTDMTGAVEHLEGDNRRVFKLLLSFPDPIER